MNPNSLMLLFWVLDIDTRFNLESDEVKKLVDSEEINYDLDEYNFLKIIRFGNLDEHLESVREIARDDLMEEVNNYYRTLKGY